MWRASSKLLLLLLIFPLSHAEHQVQQVVTFVAPDSSLVTLEKFISSANTSLYINVYTFTSPEIARIVKKELEEGTNVYIIVEGSPAGGFKQEEKRVLSWLSEGGAYVCVFTSKELRFNHAKYAIVDNTTVLITTENFGRSGFPVDGKGNRGWGVVLRDEELAQTLAGLFFRDLRSCTPYTYNFSSSLQSEYTKQEIGEFKPETYTGNFKVELGIAPENALNLTLAFMRQANKSIDVEMFYAYKYFGRGREGSPEKTPNLFLKELIDASRRGVRVRVLLDSSWYNVEKSDPRSNLYTVRYLNEIAKRENLPLKAKLGCFTDKIRKYHVKGIIVDGKAVLLGSVNWNLNSPTKNREIVVVVYGEPAEYFSRVFDHDWKLCEERHVFAYWKLLIPALLLPILLLILIARRVKLNSSTPQPRGSGQRRS